VPACDDADQSGEKEAATLVAAFAEQKPMVPNAGYFYPDERRKTLKRNARPLALSASCLQPL